MPIRLIIADDHAVIRSALKSLLNQKDDLRVVAEAGSGLDTLRAVEENDFDVLVMDLNMPGMHGVRVAEEVLKKKNVAIVVLTMHDDEYYLREMFQVGAQGFVLKKSGGEELYQAIRAVHRGEQYIDPYLSGVILLSLTKSADPQKSGRLGLLTAREREICRLLAAGHTNSEIGELLSITERTAETHRTSILKKLDLKSRASLFRFAVDNGLLKVE